jgi:competence protein ComEA
MPLLDRVRAGLDQPVAVPRRVGAAVLLGLIAAAVTLWWVLLPRSGAAPAPAMSVSAGRPAQGFATAEPSGTASPAPGGIVVDVTGAVRRPGVVRLPPGARVLDAVAAAGGLLPGAGGVNLARPLVDGEQIVVGAPGTDSAGDGGQDNGDGRMDLNRADAAALEELPGVGPVLASRIVAWRESAGGFRRVEQLQEVPGIGPAIYSGLVDLVAVG